MTKKIIIEKKNALLLALIAVVLIICLLSGCSSEPGKQSGVVRLDDEGWDEIT
ncbi:MAG: hypothetical protein IJJ31_08685 [Mogibacterium sp.]|nr:hypothetical protein [Mogibacterium sp.]